MQVALAVTPSKLRVTGPLTPNQRFGEALEQALGGVEGRS